MSKRMDNGRLVLECLAVRDRFGDRAKLCTDSRHERGWWECHLPSASRGRTVFVFYPDDYPDSPPRVIFAGRLRQGTPHVMHGNVLDICHAHGFWNGQCAAATAMLEAIEWFEGYDAWKRIRRWPVPDAVGT
jgi:hypothetical protein